MNCKSCGASNPENNLFCVECGSTLQSQGQAQSQVGVVAPEMKEKDGTIFVVLGFLFSGIALLFFPPVFGGVGIAMGYQAKKKGKDTIGVVIMAVASICLIVGMVLGVLAQQAMK